MEFKKIKSIVEAMLFVSGHPVEYNVFKSVLEIPMKDTREIIEYLNKEYEDKGSSLTIIEVAEGFQMITKPEYSVWLKKMFGNRKVMRLPQTSLETLAIIAYKQPVTKSEIDEIRGVNSDGVIKNLLFKKMIKIVGRKEIIGRPLLYGTTKEFLEYFGLRSLNDLPDEQELKIMFEANEEVTNESEKSEKNIETQNEITQNKYNNVDELIEESAAEPEANKDDTDTADDEETANASSNAAITADDEDVDVNTNPANDTDEVINEESDKIDSTENSQLNVKGEK